MIHYGYLEVPTQLPSDDSRSKSVKDFGIGTYDSPSDDTKLEGEDVEERQPAGKSLPDAGGTEVPTFETYVSYPITDYKGIHAKSMVPGDEDIPPSGPPEDKTKDIVADSDLPSDEDNPSARSDYYDRMTMGKDIEDIWADEDSGSYSMTQPKDDIWYDDQDDTVADSLPTVNKNENGLDNFLGALGNLWSGFTVEDNTESMGFPSQDFSEQADFMSDGLQPFGYNKMSTDMNYDKPRVATNIELVKSLTKDFIKKYGKKNIVKRHVLAFLQEEGHPQYLSSDIVRCLKHNHKVTIPDVLDTFPFKKEASEGHNKISNIWEKLVDLEVRYVTKPEVANEIRKCAADMAHVMAGLERLEERNGK